MEPDILPGFTRETLTFRSDHEGVVTATVVRRPCDIPSRKAVLYVHGYVDYFFNRELADRFSDEGFDFYAIDLRKYGRSLLAHQSPNDTRALETYFEDLDAAVDLIRRRDGHTFLLLVGHSTGGLTGALYADARRDAGTIDALVLNSPFFDLNGSWLNEHVVSALASGLGAVRPGLLLPTGLSPLYVESLHKDFRGEWDFRLDWKPRESFPMTAGFVHAIRQGHARLHRGLRVDAPALVMFSSASSRPKAWDDILYTTDAVLDVADIELYADRLGVRVAKARIAGGVHDLVLSRRPVRDQVYREIFDWTRAKAGVPARSRPAARPAAEERRA
ncbi:MAG TPA: alpha/beta hydrolase [Candidatus Polarisedimenticolia bacterium]|nr:alpha/beta hydrolase [Candidatus Polarisedimenticolia bacterium]